MVSRKITLINFGAKVEACLGTKIYLFFKSKARASVTNPRCCFIQSKEQDFSKWTYG